VVQLIQRTAERLDIPVMSPSSLAVRISVWENGRAVPDPSYRRLFREIYGKTNDELGFPDEPDADPLGDELHDRFVVAQRVDAAAVDLFRTQVESFRHADRRFGSAARLAQLRSHITEVESLLRHTLVRQHRASLAAALTDAATLAGWDSLDSGDAALAWDYHERAKLAAREAEAPDLLAHATAQQASILLDIGRDADALLLLEEAQSLASPTTPRLLRAWLAAALGEGYAAVGNRDGALRAFDQAEKLLPPETTHPTLAFLFLGGSHLDRWRGSALARLGEPESIDQLTAVLATGAGEFVRAHAAVRVDLAFAHARAGDRDATLSYAQQARRIIGQVGSVRQRRRLEKLILPGSAALSA
jgi:tetratricopeptide (TPR) repeat protein